MDNQKELDTAGREAESWYVYMVRCADASLYTGITKDVARRLAQHNSTGSAAKYTRSRQPVELVYYEKMADQSTALRGELKIKQMTAADKVLLAVRAGDNPVYTQDGFGVSATAIASLKKRCSGTIP